MKVLPFYTENCFPRDEINENGMTELPFFTVSETTDTEAAVQDTELHSTSRCVTIPLHSSHAFP
jgi:hypothetical protein